MDLKAECEKERGVRDDSRRVGPSNRRLQLLFPEMGRTVEGPGFRGKDELAIGHGKFQKSIK